MISHTHNIAAFPLDIASTFKPHLFSGTLLLNCLNKYNAPLWGESRQETYKHDHWSKADSRLKPFNTLTSEWQWSTPLRNWYDQHDNIIFACSKGPTCVSIDSPEWEKFTQELNPLQRTLKSGDTYTHTITKNDLYLGQQVTYYPPFDKCDRVEYYWEAWEWFEGFIGGKNEKWQRI